MSVFRLAPTLVWILVFLNEVAGGRPSAAGDWPRWRGPDGNAVSEEGPFPIHWSSEDGFRWKVRVPGEGSSSPIASGDCVFLTSALEFGNRRLVHCFDLSTGETKWTREIEDDNPEITSALTGHAAPTPVTDGECVIAFFGNAGVVCYDFQGKLLWRHEFEDFETELGIASSPIIDGDVVILVCDHDGNRFRNFDSFLIALDRKSGAVRWKIDRPGLERSWSTPIIVPAGDGRRELVVNAQDELRGYDPETGRFLWRVTGMTGWVTPSPVFGCGRIYATSGRDGPTMCVRPGGQGDVTESHVVWQHRRGAPYVCSPLLYRDHLYVHNEQGILTCFDAQSGKIVYRRRLEGKFWASGVAGGGQIYLTNDDGDTFVVRSGAEYELLAKNSVGEECLASPALSKRGLLLRTRRHLYCIAAGSANGSSR